MVMVADALAQEDTIETLLKKIQADSGKFERIEVDDVDQTVDFNLKLGESVVTLPSGSKLDGFRFKAPKDVEDYDFVWYFNAPKSWANWYLCPLEGAFERSFTSWLDADKLYKQFDRSGEEKRIRTLQTLDAGYFEAGKEYIMWFRKMDEGNGRLSGRLTFKKSEEKWDHPEIEKALKLRAMPLNAQVQELKSRGGKILLDKEFFDTSYAKNRIDNVFFSIRQTKRLKDGFFITMEISIPNCETSPSFTKIRKR